MELYDVMRTTSPCVNSPTILFPTRSSTGSSTTRDSRPAANRQGTHVTVVRDATVRQRLAELNVPARDVTSLS